MPMPAMHATSLSSRLAFGLAAAMALITMAFVAFTLRMAEANRDELADFALSTQAQMLREVLLRNGDGALALATRLADNPALATAAAARDDVAASAALAAGVAGRADVVRAFVVDAQDRLLAAVNPRATDMVVAAAPASGRGSDRGRAITGPARDGEGKFVLRATVPVGTAPGVAGSLTLDLDMSGVLTELEANTGAGVALIDPRGVVMTTDSPAVAAAHRSFGPEIGGLQTVYAGRQALAVSAVPLLDGTGARLGTEIQVRDITDQDGQRRFLATVSATLLGLVLLVVPLALFYLFNRSFQPLASVVAALTALTKGDVEVELSGEDRQDEIGQIARSVRILRDGNRALARQRSRTERGRRRQHRFIRQQMSEMGAAFDATRHAEAHADAETVEDVLTRLETGQAAAGGGELDALALAFRITAQRVIAQNGRMDTLVDQLQGSLQTRTELIGLQQQLQIASRMQAGLLPQVLPPRPDVQARGGLLPAREFGGDFYDFFPLGPGQLAVVAGNAGGSGLRSAFLTLTARTLLKAVLVCGLGPGAAMTRVNALLAAEEGGAEGVSAVVLLLDIANSRLTCCNASFPNPLMLRRLGDAAALSLADGPPLGRRQAMPYVETQIDIPPRTTLVVFSPGFAGGDEGSLLAALAACMDPGTEAVLNTMMSAASHGGGDADQDASCVVVRYAAAK